jgi:hypothetical protein
MIVDELPFSSLRVAADRTKELLEHVRRRGLNGRTIAVPVMAAEEPSISN